MTNIRNPLMKEDYLTDRQLATLTKDEIIQRLNISSYEYKSLPIAMREDEDVALTAYKTSILGNNPTEAYLTLNQIPDCLKNDREFILKWFSLPTGKIYLSIPPIRAIPQKYLSDKEVMLVVVKNYPSALSVASEKIKDDFDVVKMAVSSSGTVHVYASARLRKDKLLAAITLCHTGDYLGLIDSGIQDEELFRRVFETNPYTLFEMRSSSPVGAHYVELINKVLKSPPLLPEPFYVEKLMAENSVLAKLEFKIEDYNTEFDANGRKKLKPKTDPTKAINYQINDRIPTVDYLMEAIPLVTIRSIGGASKTFKERLARRELLSINQNKGKFEIKEKSRKTYTNK